MRAALVGICQRAGFGGQQVIAGQKHLDGAIGNALLPHILAVDIQRERRVTGLVVIQPLRHAHFRQSDRQAGVAGGVERQRRSTMGRARGKHAPDTD